MGKTTRILGIAAAFAWTTPAMAQTITPIVETGTVLPGGVGTVTIINGMAVNDAGHVLVNVITNNSITYVAMVDETGAVVARAGDVLSQPPGATIAGFDNYVAMSGSSDPAFFLALSNTAGGAGVDDEGIYHGVPLNLGIQLSAACTAPEAPTGSSFSLLLPPYVNDSNMLCFHSELDDPAIPGGFNLAALLLLDPSTGIQHALHQEGETLPGQSFPISSFNWNSTGTAFNNGGQVLFGAQTLGPSGLNEVLYLDNAKIAQTGDTSPFGLAYTSLATSVLGVDLNNHADYVFTCGLSGSSRGIVLDNTPFVQVGDSPPSIEPFQISEFGERLCVGDDGRVLWYGVWDLPGGTQGKGLFADYSLLVEQGETLIHGLHVQQITGLENCCTMSRGGRYALFLATLEDGTQGAYLIDLWQ